VAPSVENDAEQKFRVPFPVPRRKVWLTPTARVPCSNAANIGERKTWTQSAFCTWLNSVRGQELPEMYTQCTSAGDGQTSCKVWLTSVERRRCSYEAKMRNPLKIVGVAQIRQPMSAVSGPTFTILREHVAEILLIYTFFRLSIHALLAKIPTKLCDGAQMAIFCVIDAS